MTRKTLFGFLGALLVLPLGALLAYPQAPKAAKPPGPPVAATPALAPEEPLDEIEMPEPPEIPEPPELAKENSWFMVGEGGAWLGVRLREITAEKARDLKLASEDGALVMEVEPASPAAKAGFEKNDVILEYAGERVHSVAQLQRLVRETPVGRAVSVQVNRAGQVKTLSVKLAEGWDHFKMPHVQMPELRMPDFGGALFHNRHAPTLGIAGEALTSQLAGYFAVKQGKGVLVREVKAGSAAEKAGLKAGDVIVKIDSTGVGSVEELREALPRDLEESKKISLTVVRDRREQTIGLELEPTLRAPLRRAEAFGIPQVDLEAIRQQAEEIRRQAEEIRRQSGKFREEALAIQRNVNEQKLRWQEEARRAVERSLRELQKDRNLRVRELASPDGVI